jgi:hypothetical protein
MTCIGHLVCAACEFCFTLFGVDPVVVQMEMIALPKRL